MTLRYDTRSRVSTYTQSWLGDNTDYGAFESIATTTLSSSTGSVTFSSIPQTYKHLQVRYIARSDYGFQDGFKIQLNGVTTSSYSYHYLGGNGSSTYSGSGVSQTFMQGTTFPGTGTTGIFGAGVLDLLDYANVNKYKTVRSLGGFDSNGGGVIEMWSGAYLSTDAITSIRLFSFGAANFIANSSFALYGIKA